MEAGRYLIYCNGERLFGRIGMIILTVKNWIYHYFEFALGSEQFSNNIGPVILSYRNIVNAVTDLTSGGDKLGIYSNCSLL